MPTDDPGSPERARPEAPPASRPAGVFDWALAVIVALVVGWTAREIGMPAGIVFGSTVGSATVALGRARAWRARMEARVAVMIAVGIMAGVSLTPDVLRQMPEFLIGATLTTALLVLAAFLVVAVLGRLHRAPAGGVLAALPGALEALTAIVAGQRSGGGELAWFHTVRVIVVVLSVPLLLWLNG